jgi:hypothetical protein
MISIDDFCLTSNGKDGRQFPYSFSNETVAAGLRKLADAIERGEAPMQKISLNYFTQFGDFATAKLHMEWAHLRVK